MQALGSGASRVQPLYRDSFLSPRPVQSDQRERHRRRDVSCPAANHANGRRGIPAVPALESHDVTSARRARIFIERRSRVSERKLEWVAGLPTLGLFFVGEEHADAGTVVNTADGLSEQWGDGNDFNFGTKWFNGRFNGVRHKQFFDQTVLNSIRSAF